MKSNTRLLLRLGGAAALVPAAALALLAGCQNQMIYFPSKRSEAQALAEASPAGLLPWRTAEGRLIGWRSPTVTGSNRLLVFHGNAGMALNRSYFADGFRNAGNAGWEIYIMEYPGYGSREGKPGEASFAVAGREALRELQRESQRLIFVLGESIGSGTAAKLAGEFPDTIAGLILITPFTSLTDVAAIHYPWIPVRLIMRDRYDNVGALAKYRGPLAVIIAGHDGLVTAKLGQRLFDGYGYRKRLWLQEEAGHNSLDYRPGAAWLADLSRFIIESR